VDRDLHSSRGVSQKVLRKTFMRQKVKQFRVTTSRNQRGFTLIELMVTVGLIGIVVSLAVPSFMGSLPRIRLRSATRALSSDIRRARSEAISRNKLIYVVFPVTGTTYTVREDSITGPVIMNVDLAEEFNGVSFGLGTVVPNSKPPGVLPTGAPGDSVDFTDNNIRLDALGRSMKAGAPENGEIYLTNTLGEIYCITVLGTSGRVKVYRWTGGVWQS